jgi:hypothetical protein
MSTSDTAGFGKFVPGFDFLQNLAKAAGGAGGSPSAMPNMAQWLVPSLKVEDLEKRIEELKHVQFWLDQNARALSATIQALEVQKMTMETLKGMNFSMGMTGAASAAPATPAPEPPAAKPEPAPAAQRQAKTDKGSAEAATVIDPVALWGSLTQQFQTIAANALKDVAKHSTPPVKKAPVRSKAATKAKPATKTAARTRRKAS